MATMYDPPHLGELIRESIEAKGWTVVETAKRLDMGRVALSRVLNGHAGVSAALALALERTTGGPRLDGGIGRLANQLRHHIGV